MWQVFNIHKASGFSFYRNKKGYLKAILCFQVAFSVVALWPCMGGNSLLHMVALDNQAVFGINYVEVANGVFIVV